LDSLKKLNKPFQDKGLVDRGHAVDVKNEPKYNKASVLQPFGLRIFRSEFSEGFLLLF